MCIYVYDVLLDNRLSSILLLLVLLNWHSICNAIDVHDIFSVMHVFIPISILFPHRLSINVGDSVNAQRTPSPSMYILLLYPSFIHRILNMTTHTVPFTIAGDVARGWSSVEENPFTSTTVILTFFRTSLISNSIGQHCHFEFDVILL